jgi:hypothetical protein
MPISRLRVLMQRSASSRQDLLLLLRSRHQQDPSRHHAPVLLQRPDRRPLGGAAQRVGKTHPLFVCGDNRVGRNTIGSHGASLAAQDHAATQCSTRCAKIIVFGEADPPSRDLTRPKNFDNLFASAMGAWKKLRFLNPEPRLPQLEDPRHNVKDGAYRFRPIAGFVSRE